MDLEQAQREENNLNSLIPDATYTADTSSTRGVTMKTTESQESRIRGVGARFADFFEGAGSSGPDDVLNEDNHVRVSSLRRCLWSSCGFAVPPLTSVFFSAWAAKVSSTSSL